MRLFCKSRKVYVLRGRMLMLFAIIFILIVVYLFVYNTCFSGTIKEKARVKANYVAISAINQTTEKLLLDAEFDEENFFTTENKINGTVSKVTVDSKTANLFKAKLSQGVLDMIDKYGKEVIEMAPFSSYGYSFVPFGIRIPVLVVPIEILSLDFKSELVDSGINQTLYRLNIEVEIAVKLLLPIGSEIFNVKTTVPVVQTVIVGDIPDSYTNVEGVKETGPDTILDIAS